MEGGPPCPLWEPPVVQARTAPRLHKGCRRKIHRRFCYRFAGFAGGMLNFTTGTGVSSTRGGGMVTRVDVGCTEAEGVGAKTGDGLETRTGFV